MLPGDLLERGVARHAAAIAAQDASAEPDNFKFLCEAVIATGVQTNPTAVELNGLLGNILFKPATALRFVRHPRLCAQYALPLAFLHHPPPAAQPIASLFLELHAAGAVQAVSYPEYRNTEMDYVAAKLSGRDFGPVPLDRFALAFGWMTRDHSYGVTHLMLYNSDFGRRKVRYANGTHGMIEAMIAGADKAGDIDLLLELILCHATMIGADANRARDYAALVREHRESLETRIKRADGDDAFANLYHPLFVAWIHAALNIAEAEDGRERQRHHARGAVMAAFAGRDPIAALASTADLLAEFGSDPAIERLADFQGRLIAGAAPAPSVTAESST